MKTSIPLSARIEAPAERKDAYYHYESRLDRNYSVIGEKCSTMVERKISVLLRFLGSQKPSRKYKILDVGCGVGLSENKLSQSPSIESVTGVDLSMESLETARNRRLPSTHYLQASGVHLPFHEAAFDVVFTICTLHHVSPRLRAEFMRELCRVLRPGGWLFAFEHNPYNPITRFFVRQCEFDRGCELLGPGELARNFLQANLQDISRHFIIFFPSFLRYALAAEKYLSWCPLGAQFVVKGRK